MYGVSFGRFIFREVGFFSGYLDRTGYNLEVEGIFFEVVLINWR